MSPRRSFRQQIPPDAITHLRSSDATLADVIDRVGVFEPSHEPDLWWSLVDSITSQQLSVRAAATIAGRIEALGGRSGKPSPETIAAMPDETLRACGLSGAKTRYVKDLAHRWASGELRPDLLPTMADEEAIDHLTQVKGIGRWTAEMVLIFSLGRADVLPVDDLGLRSAVQLAYRLGERPQRDELIRLGEPWRPFRTFATLFLWRSLSLPRTESPAISQ